MYENIVLIAGAGPAGLTLAIDLARRGVAIRVIDAASTPFAGSRGKGIQPRTLDVFDDLGVIDAILAGGGLYPRMRYHFGPFSLPGKPMAPTRPATASTPYPNPWMVPQARTEAILRERLKALGGVVEFGTALVSFSQNDRGVEASLSTGEVVRAAYLVGADGGRSAVRKALGLKLSGETIDERLRMVADLEVDGLDRAYWHIWPIAKGGMILLCPLAKTDLFQYVSAAKAAEKGIEAHVRAATGHTVTRIAWSSTYQPSARMVDRYRVGRVFLAGDAAHVHPPTGGQGLNTSVQDSYNLGWKLAHVMRGGPDALLDTYEEERLPVAASVLGLSKQLYVTRSRKRGDATNQLSLNYRTSSLSSGAPYGSLHPGDRMPDAQLEDGGRLFDRLRGPHATELVMPDGIRILIRPDGYIARIGTSPVGEYAGAPTHRVAAPALRR